MIQQGVVVLGTDDLTADELCISIYNFTNERAIILGGETMAHAVFVKAEQVNIQEEK